MEQAREGLELRLDEHGLVPAIVQDARTGQVLMLGWMNPGALRRTLEGGEAWFFSRSRSDLWRKGELSGNGMRVAGVWADCDGDALLVQVEPTGPACHTGEATCFHNPVQAVPPFRRVERGPGILEELFQVIQDRRRDRPEGSYTTRLLEQGRARIAQKVLEEAGEVVIAGLQGQGDRLAEESADLLYHLLVLLADAGVSPEAVWAVLRRRRGTGAGGGTPPAGGGPG